MKTFGWTCTITPFNSPVTSEQTYNYCCPDKWQNVISASPKLTSSCPKTLALLLHSPCTKTWVWTSRFPSLTGRKTLREGQNVRFWRWLSIKWSKHRFSFTSRKSGTIRIHFTRQSSQPGPSRRSSAKAKPEESAATKKLGSSSNSPKRNSQSTDDPLLSWPRVSTGVHTQHQNHVENLLNTQIPVPPPSGWGPKGWKSEFLLRAPSDS